MYTYLLCCFVLFAIALLACCCYNLLPIIMYLIVLRMLLSEEGAPCHMYGHTRPCRAPILPPEDDVE